MKLPLKTSFWKYSTFTAVSVIYPGDEWQSGITGSIVTESKLYYASKGRFGGKQKISNV